VRLAFALALLCATFCAPARAEPLHALAMHGAPQYGPDFAHFGYVNPHAPKGGALRLHRIGTFDSLNPFGIKGTPAAGLPFLGQGLVYEPLMVRSYDEPFTMYCLLCVSVEVAPDRRWVRFAMHPKARFADGKAVTAQDVAWTFETLMSRGSPFYKAYYGDVERVEAAGDHVTFYTDAPDNAELPLILGQMPVLPAHAYAPDAALADPVGSGPYRVQQYEPGRSISYEKRVDWWGAGLPMNRGRYNFGRITYDYYRDDSAAMEAFLAGAYDLRLEQSAQNWAKGYTGPAVRDGRITKTEIPHEQPQGMSGFVFNTRRPVFRDPATRRALAMAFDFAWANQAFAGGRYKRSVSYFSNSELAAPDGAPAPPFDLRAAARALDKAGWAVGPDGIRARAGQRLAFEVLLDSPAIARWAVGLVANWRKIGVDARMRTVDPALYQKRLMEFDYDMVYATFAQSDSPGNEQRDFWSSAKASIPGSRNYAGVADPSVDAAIEAIIRASSRADLIQRCRGLDRLLREGAYVIPGWHLAHWRLAWWAQRIQRPQAMPPMSPAITDTWWATPP
jgi:microcin C transport system substrate-binding protein